MAKKVVDTPLDRQINNKMNELRDIMRTLQARVRQVLIKEKAVSVYPDGADKKKAEDVLELEKQKVLCSIASYDCRYMELTQLLSRNEERKTTQSFSLPCTSHEYVETIITSMIFSL